MQSSTIKPPLRWVGSKYNQPTIYKRLIELYAPFANTHTWVEPFCGGLGATLRVQPKSALLNDDNKQLINFYKWYWSFGYGYDWTNLEPVVTKENYYHNRDVYNSMDVNAPLFWWLNHACFQGLYRVNASGDFNTPIGKDSKTALLKITFPTQEQILNFATAADDWTFHSDTYEKFLYSIEPEGQYVIYNDPPYDDGFSSYTNDGFSWIDQKKLAKTIADQCCPAIISNLATDRIVELYQGLGYTLEFMDCRRSVAANGGRVPVKEVLATINMEF